MQKIRKVRNRDGSILLLTIGIAPLLVVSLLFMLQSVMLFLEQSRLQKTADSAALAAANAISQIVINDPHFGYVSLSDFAPVGKATVAADGQALPVIGINTLIGTARLDLLIATNTGEASLIQSAREECLYMHQTVNRLNQALTESVLSPTSTASDLNGLPVCPQSSALSIVKQNLGTCKPGDLQLQIGYSTAGYATVTPAPAPKSLAQLPPDAVLSNCYKACINIPAADQDFYFAGVSNQSALTDPTKFASADNIHPLSIIHVTLKSPEAASNLLPIVGTCLQANSAAIPAANTAHVPPGMLVVWNPVSTFPSNLNLSTIMGCTNGLGTVGISAGGDYGTDVSASIQQTGSLSTGSYVSHAILCWLRSAQLLPRIDSAASMFNQQLDNVERMTVYDFAPDGQSLVVHPSQSAFSEQRVSEQQTCFVSRDALGNGSNYNLVCHNQVGNLGIASGGKHAGQPLPGDPLNWMELVAFNGGQTLDGQTGTGQHYMDVSLQGSSSGCAAAGINLDEGAISATTAIFTSTSGSGLNVQPRKTYYAGGEAVYLQLSPASVEGH